jgi:hypothetical protein
VQNARINYTLKLLKQPLVGNIGDIIEINGVLLDELEEEDLSNKLIEEGYYESRTWLCWNVALLVLSTVVISYTTWTFFKGGPEEHHHTMHMH